MVISMERLILSFFLPLLAAFAPLTHADQNDPRLDAYFAALYQTQDVAQLKALESRIWDAWRETDQADANALFAEGMNAMQAADFRLAIELFTETIAIAPDFAEAYNMRATTHFLLGNNSESLTDVAVTINLEPRHFGALMGGAQIAIRSGQIEVALEFVEAALKVSPNNADWQGMAQRLRDMTGTLDL